jgi:hypothetical protein
MKKFNINIITDFFNCDQTWTFHDEIKDGCKILRNFFDYSTDTFLLLDKDNNVIDGYELIYNNSSTLTVTEIKE